MIYEYSNIKPPGVKRRRGRPRKNKDPEPHGVVVKTSNVSAPHLGVFTKTTFPKSVSFGPYNAFSEKKHRSRHR